MTSHTTSNPWFGRLQKVVSMEITMDAMYSWALCHGGTTVGDRRQMPYQGDITFVAHKREQKSNLFDINTWKSNFIPNFLGHVISQSSNAAYLCFRESYSAGDQLISFLYINFQLKSNVFKYTQLFLLLIVKMYLSRLSVA